MSNALQDEVLSINAIYGDATLSVLPDQTNIYALLLPKQPHISVRVEFPTDYPDAPPAILGTQSNDAAKGEGRELVEIVRAVLAEIYLPGLPCVFDLVEEVGQRLEPLRLHQGSKDEEQQNAQANGQHSMSEEPEHTPSDLGQSLEMISELPAWTLSEVITEKKSVFLARSALVTSVDQAKHYLAHLLSTDKKVAKATHNITAWRIRGENGVQFQDSDDDGETAAGGRVLHLLELMDAWGIMVVVTRWYGGIQLGPDRFRIINQTARDAVVKGGFVLEVSKDDKGGHKKKGRK